MYSIFTLQIYAICSKKVLISISRKLNSFLIDITILCRNISISI